MSAGLRLNLFRGGCAAMIFCTSLAAQHPTKLSVHARESSYSMGSNVPVEIVVLDAANRPCAVQADAQIDVTVISPSHKTSTVAVVIPRGQSEARAQVKAAEPGVQRLNAHHHTHELFDGNSSFLVRSSGGGPPVSKRSATPPRDMRIGRMRSRDLSVESSRDTPPIEMPAPVPSLPSGSPRYPSITVATITPAAGPASIRYTPPPAAVPESLPVGSAKLVLDVPDRGSGYRADGVDFAPLSVYYMSEDGSRAPTDIEVILSATGAEVDPSRIIIKKGTDLGEAKVTSKSRSMSDAVISFVESFPSREVAGAKERHVSFVPPIYRISVAPLSLSLVDRVTMAASFLDGEDKSIKSGMKRKVSFQTKDSAVRLANASVDVGEADLAASDMVLPVSIGNADVEVFMDGFEHQHVKVSVTGTAVILMLLAGSLLGGLCAFLQRKDRLAMRLFTGLVGGALSAWLYVYLGLPFLDAGVAHSTLSVLFVAIIGGYAGTQVVDMLTKPLLKSPA